MDLENHTSHGDFTYELKIPEERVAVLIGTDGKTKKEIETETKCLLDITKEGEVIIRGEDGLKLFTAREIVRSIARGFNPKTALLLIKQDYSLEFIDMKDVAGKSKNTLQRLKGRVIGKGGKSREEIERLTDTYISVYGKTIGIIGETTQVSIARQAVAMLLQGSMHKTVFQFLEKKKKEMMFG
jgi:ribosomal RNA assembly protein